MIFADMPLPLRSVKSFTAVPFGILPNSRSSSRCSEAPLAGFHETANTNNARMVFKTWRRMAESCPALYQTQTESGGRPSGLSLRLPAVNLDLGVFVESAFGAAFGVETNVAGLDPFGVDQLAFAGLDVFATLADTQAGGVVRVVVEDRADVPDEVRVIGDLHDDVVIDLGQVVGVPDHQGDELLRAAEIHLHPLPAFPQEEDVLVGCLFVAIGEFGQTVGGDVLIAALHFAAGRDVRQAGRDHHWRTGLVRERLDVG